MYNYIMVNGGIAYNLMTSTLCIAFEIIKATAKRPSPALKLITNII